MSKRTVGVELKSKNNSKLWNLNWKQYQHFVSEGFLIETVLFKISTRKLKNYSLCNNKLLKELHYAYKNKKRYIVRQLTPEQVQRLQEEGLKVTPFKYHIMKKY